MKVRSSSKNEKKKEVTGLIVLLENKVLRKFIIQSIKKYQCEHHLHIIHMLHVYRNEKRIHKKKPVFISVKINYRKIYYCSFL